MYNIHDIVDMLGLQASEDPYKYEGVFIAGDFDGLFDYDAGLLQVSISISQEVEGCRVFFTITTIDDGMWQAISKSMSRKEADTLADKIYNEYPWDTKLPHKDEMISFLASFQMYGKYDS